MFCNRIEFVFAITATRVRNRAMMVGILMVEVLQYKEFRLLNVRNDLSCTKCCTAYAGFCWVVSCRPYLILGSWLWWQLEDLLQDPCCAFSRWDSLHDGPLMKLSIGNTNLGSLWNQWGVECVNGMLDKSDGRMQPYKVTTTLWYFAFIGLPWTDTPCISWTCSFL